LIENSPLPSPGMDKVRRSVGEGGEGVRRSGVGLVDEVWAARQHRVLDRDLHRGFVCLTHQIHS
jgi:hypothetical protein